MKSQVAPMEGNKVKLSVEVEETEVERAVDETFDRFTKELTVPGFRRGKVPRRVLEARIGKAVARREALDKHIPVWYGWAVNDKSVDVINEPTIEVTAGQEQGPLSFDAVVEVRPRLKLEGYQGLKVRVPSPVVTATDIQAQIDRLRGNFAELAVVEREARIGDSVIIDMNATRDGKPVAGMSYSDYSVELGAGNDLPELDEHLPGAKAGASVTFEADLGGATAQVEVQVKQVQEKVLPEETDEWASEASEFSTVVELRKDIETRLSEVKRAQAALTLRNAVLEGLVGLVNEEPPSVLVDAETQHMAEELGNRLDAQGIPLQRYLDALSKTLEELVGQLKEQAVPAVKSDLALRSIADAVGIEPSEAEMEDFMGRMAAQAGVDAQAFISQVERAGRRLAVRSDLRKSKAFDWVVEHAEISDEEGNPVDRASLARPSEATLAGEAPATGAEGTGVGVGALATGGTSGTGGGPAAASPARPAAGGAE
ncbi:MAG TPA: trigger factor [Acidimicrobiales bacterium]|nr:trigger factor [Acidimicrobiales bacterium]